VPGPGLNPPSIPGVTPVAPRADHVGMGEDSPQRPTGTDDAIIMDAGLDTSLPAGVARGLGRLLGDGPVATLGDWAAAVRAATGGGAITRQDLCHTDDRSPHHAVLDGQRYDFACFYDAVILAGLADAPVAIHTESPGGTPITADATGTTSLAVSPASAVFSVGVADDVAPPDGAPTHATVYAAVCPYVRAFPDPGAYRAWRSTVDAATVAMPLAGATDLATALID